VLIHPWDVALDDEEWRTWLAMVTASAGTRRRR